MTCWNCCCLHATFLIPQHMATVQNLLITARSPSWDTCAFALHTLYQCPQIKHCKSFMQQVDVLIRPSAMWPTLRQLQSFSVTLLFCI